MVKEAIFMYVGKDGKLHYITKEQFESVMAVMEKGANVAINIAILNSASLLLGGNVFAAEAVKVSLAEGLQPIVNMIAECAYPVAGGYMVKGFLKVCQGHEEEGKRVLKNAGIGYMGTLFIPQILTFLSKLKLFA